MLNDARDLLLERGHGPGRAGRDRLPARRDVWAEGLCRLGPRPPRVAPHRRGRAGGSRYVAACRAPPPCWSRSPRRQQRRASGRSSPRAGRRTASRRARSGSCREEQPRGGAGPCGPGPRTSRSSPAPPRPTARHRAARRAPTRRRPGPARPVPRVPEPHELIVRAKSRQGVLYAIGDPGQGQHDLIGRQRHGRLLATTTPPASSPRRPQTTRCGWPRRSERVTPPRRARGSGLLVPAPTAGTAAGAARPRSRIRRAEIRPLQPEARRPRAVPAGPAEGGRDEPALELLDGRVIRPHGLPGHPVREPGLPDLGGQILRRDVGPVGEDDGALDHVLELAHVPRPGVAAERRQRRGRDAVERALSSCR